MIVYNAGRRWFDMKSDACAYAKEIGLKHADVRKLSIGDRKTLAGLLDALCSQDGNMVHPIAEDVTVTVQPTVDIPAFLDKGWQEARRSREKEIEQRGW